MYLYRNKILSLCSKFRYLFLFFCIACTAVYYLLPSSIYGFEITFYKNFILYSFWLFYAIGVDSKILGNKIMSFLSGISLEIYLSHMFVFRFMEKLHVQYLFGEDNWVSYIILCSFTLIGLFALIFGYKLMVKLFKEKIFCRIMNKGESRESNEQ